MEDTGEGADRKDQLMSGKLKSPKKIDSQSIGSVLSAEERAWTKDSCEKVDCKHRKQKCLGKTPTL